MKSYLLDTFCWIELFQGGAKAGAVKRILGEKNAVLLVSSLSLAEIAAKLSAIGKSQEVSQVLAAITAKASVVEIDAEIAGSAGRLWAQHHAKEGIGLIDCVIAASALARNASVVTGDPHFKVFSNSVIL